MTESNGAADQTVRYLLDEMSPPEQEAFEDGYFASDESFEDLLAAEDELIDLYCRGALTPERRARFEGKYLSTPEGRERVEFARALQGLSVTPARPRTSWLPLAAGLAAALAGGALFQLARVSGELTRTRSERQDLAQRMSDQEQLAAERGSRLERLENELARARGLQERLEDLLAEARQATGIVSLALSAGAVREAGPAPRLVIEPATSLVRLRLGLEETAETARFASYSATLETVEGRVLSARSGLRPRKVDGGTAVVFTMGAEVLIDGHHVVRLFGLRADGGREVVADYSFQAVRRPATSMR